MAFSLGQASVALNHLLVSLPCLVGRKHGSQTDRHTNRPTTTTLAVHARRGLMKSILLLWFILCPSYLLSHGLRFKNGHNGTEISQCPVENLVYMVLHACPCLVTKVRVQVQLWRSNSEGAAFCCAQEICNNHRNTVSDVTISSPHLYRTVCHSCFTHCEVTMLYC